MSELYGDDIITITDEDGKEYVLEVLAVLEMDGTDYYALVPAEAEEDEAAEDDPFADDSDAETAEDDPFADEEASDDEDPFGGDDEIF